MAALEEQVQNQFCLNQEPTDKPIFLKHVTAYLSEISCLDWGVLAAVRCLILIKLVE